MRTALPLPLAPALLLSTVGSACTVATAPEPAQPAEPEPKTSQAAPEAEQAASVPTVEQLRDECLSGFLPGVDLNELDLEARRAELDTESPEAVRQFERLEAVLEDAHTLCDERALANHDRAICVQSVAPEHVKGCSLYPRTHRLTVELRTAPTAVVEIADQVHAYWLVEHPHPDWPTQHGCPTEGSRSGDTGFVPPLHADCGASQSGWCEATDNPQQPWEFADDLLGPGTAWHELGLRPAMDRLKFHYRFEWRNESGGCIFEVEVRPAATRDEAGTAFRMEYAVDGDGMNQTTAFEPGMTFEADE